MPWSDPERDSVVKALAVVCEVTDTQLSDGAKKFMVRELEAHPSRRVLVALRRCARECKRKLALADVLERVEEEREKDAGRNDAELTLLRLDALDARIEWDPKNLPAIREKVAAWRQSRALPAPKGDAPASAILKQIRQRFDARAAAAGERDE